MDPGGDIRRAGDESPAGGGRRRRNCRMARLHGRLLPNKRELPVHGGGSVGVASRRLRRLRGEHRRPRRPYNLRVERLLDDDRAVLHARRPGQPGPGHDHLQG